MISSILNDIAGRYGLKKGSGRWSGPCPECGGSKASDKFVIKIDGGFKCYSCDFRGDIVTWLRRKEGKSCPEAHEAAGIPCRSSSCAVKGTCRLGDGSGRRQEQKRRSVAPPSPTQADMLPCPDVRYPSPLWRTWASSVVDKSHAALSGSRDIISWLARRGIDASACDRFQLGWRDHDERIIRSSIGLQPKEGKDKIWIPGGLVIPTIAADGSIHRLRIRRTDAARGKFLPDLKYVWIEGSGTAPLVIRPSGTPRGAVIVESELDALATSSHSGVIVIALGTVSAGLPRDILTELASIPVILVALDADTEKDGSPGPGPRAVARWKTTFRHARFWPVPSGKDPGEYAEQGGQLTSWIEAGLPPAPPVHDLPLSPDGSSTGDGGKTYYDDLAELRELLIESRGRIQVTDDGLNVVKVLPEHWRQQNIKKSGRISALLNTSETVADFIAIVGDGIYGPEQMRM